MVQVSCAPDLGASPDGLQTGDPMHDTPTALNLLDHHRSANGGGPAGCGELRHDVPPDLTVTVTVAVTVEGRQMVRVALDGELDCITVHQARQTLLASLTTAVTRIEVDAVALGFCDAAGLTFFLDLDGRCAAQGGGLRIVHPRRQLSRLLELTGTLHLLSPAANASIG